MLGYLPQLQQPLVHLIIRCEYPLTANALNPVPELCCGVDKYVRASVYGWCDMQLWHPLTCSEHRWKEQWNSAMQARYAADTEMAQVSDQEASASVDDSVSDRTAIPPALLYEEVRSITSAVYAAKEDAADQEWTTVPSKHGNSRSQPQPSAQESEKQAASRKGGRKVGVPAAEDSSTEAESENKAESGKKEARHNSGRGRGRGRGRGQGMYGSTGRGRGRGGRGRSNALPTDATSVATAGASNSTPNGGNLESSGAETTMGPAHASEKRRNAGRGRHVRRRPNPQHAIPGHGNGGQPTEKRISVHEVFSY